MLERLNGQLGHRRRAEMQDQWTLAELRQAYEAATSTRLRKRIQGINPMGSSADWHIRTEAQYLSVIEYARDIARNDNIVGQGIRRLVNNVIQSGIAYNPNSGDHDFDRELLDRWTDWSRDANLCDAAREHTLTKLAKLAMSEMIIAGEQLISPIARTGALEPIEAHRIRTPFLTTRDIVHGYRINARREKISAFVFPEALNPNDIITRRMQFTEIAMRDQFDERVAFQVYNPHRTSQTRGLSHLAPIMDTALMYSDLNFAQLVKANVASAFAILEEVDVEAAATPNSPEFGPRETTTNGSHSTLWDQIGPGMYYRSAPGHSLKAFAPNVPNAEFFQHSTLLLSIIAANLDIPIVVLLLDPSRTNFSGWRGSMDSAKIGFRDLQQLMIDRFYEPIFRWKFRWWYAMDEGFRRRVDALGPAAFKHDWQRPSWPYIEPKKDAEAIEVRRRTYQSSPRRLLAEISLDWPIVAAETAEDHATLIERCIEAAQRLNEKHPGAHVTWQQVANPVQAAAAQGAARVTEDLARALQMGVTLTEEEVRLRLGLDEKPSGTPIGGKEAAAA